MGPIVFSARGRAPAGATRAARRTLCPAIDHGASLTRPAAGATLTAALAGGAQFRGFLRSRCALLEGRQWRWRPLDQVKLAAHQVDPQTVLRSRDHTTLKGCITKDRLKILKARHRIREGLQAVLSPQQLSGLDTQLQFTRGKSATTLVCPLHSLKLGPQARLSHASQRLAGR